MQKILLTSALLLLAACSNLYNDHYYKNGTLHPELVEKQKQECLEHGFKNKSEKLAECRQQLAQDWKNNLEAGRRDRSLRPSFGIHYGIGHRW